MGKIRLEGLSNYFGTHAVIPGVDLDIADGEFVVFGGPSCCGKSTLPRLIAGLEDVAGGRIIIAGTNVAARHGCATIGIRPEHIRTARDGEGWPGTAAVAVAEHLGSDTFLYVDAGEAGQVTARVAGELNFHAGDRIILALNFARLHRFDADGMAIH